MALEVTEQNYGEKELVLVGIEDSGLMIANKISNYLKEVFTGAQYGTRKANPLNLTFILRQCSVYFFEDELAPISDYAVKNIVTVWKRCLKLASKSKCGITDF